MAAERLYIISDLHIGDGRVPPVGAGYPRDNFLYKDKYRKFNQFLDQVEREGAELIILGDLLDCWLANLDQVIINNWALLDRLAGMRVRYIPGNHDMDLAAFYSAQDPRIGNFPNHPFLLDRDKVTPTLERRIGDTLYVFRHGHEGDDFNNKTYPVTGRMVTVLAGLIEDRYSRYLDNNGAQDFPLEPTLTAVGQFLLWLLEPVIHRLGQVHEPLAAARNAGATEYEKRLEMEDMVVERLFDGLGDRLAVPDDEVNERGVCKGVIGDLTRDYLMRQFKKWAENRSQDGNNLTSHLQAMHAIWSALPDRAHAIMMVGHTHMPGLCRLKPDPAERIWYYNTGSWSDTNHDVVSISPGAGIQYHVWEDGGLRKRETVDDFSKYLHR